MKKNLLLFLTAFIFIYVYYPISFPRGAGTIASTVPDADADYLIPLRISQGQGLYSNFSILYPPGRFLVEAVLFKLFTPTFAIEGLLHNITAVVFFPAVLLILSYFLFENLFRDLYFKNLQKLVPLIAYLLALVVTVVNLLFFRFAQETHVFIALFFIILLSITSFSKKSFFLLGLLIGLVFLFRMDAGILLCVSMFIAAFPHIARSFKRQQTNRNIVLLGLLTVWLPLLIAFIFHGSLVNFLYDTLVLGLIVQPKFMSLPIPVNELRLVFLSSLILLTTASLSLFQDAKKLTNFPQQIGLKAFSILAVLSYVSALGRSDEPHLWYGLIWMVPLVVYTVLRIFVAIMKREMFSLKTLLVFGVACFAFSDIILHFKSPTLFILSIALLFTTARYKTFSILSVLCGGLVAALLTFHSVSYLKLQMSFPWPPGHTPLDTQLITNDGTGIGGLHIDTQTKLVLDQIRLDIPQSEQYLFIFPKSVLWNEYLHLENPTRYIILAQERSRWTEREVIESINSTHTQYFLIFVDAARLRRGPVWEWLLANTDPVHTYLFGKEEAVLTKRRTDVTDKPIEYWLQF